MGISAAFMVPHPPLIVAEVGRGEERKIQRTIDAYGEVARRIGALRPETIVVISTRRCMRIISTSRQGLGAKVTLANSGRGR